MNIFSRLFPVCYGQFYFISDVDWYGDMRACFSAQKNGLCGVSVEGIIFFVTGLHTGNITLTINYLDSEPDIDDLHNEIVEASFKVSDSGIRLEAWGEEVKEKMPLLPGTYRIRYSAKNFGLAEELGKYDEGDVEFYRIEIWPAPYAEDNIIKVTTESAKYWHSEVENCKV